MWDELHELRKGVEAALAVADDGLAESIGIISRYELEMMLHEVPRSGEVDRFIKGLYGTIFERYMIPRDQLDNAISTFDSLLGVAVSDTGQMGQSDALKSLTSTKVEYVKSLKHQSRV